MTRIESLGKKGNQKNHTASFGSRPPPNGLLGSTGSAFIPLGFTPRPYLLFGLSGAMWLPPVPSTPTARGATLGKMGMRWALPKVQAEERSDEAKVAKECVERADLSRWICVSGVLGADSRSGDEVR